MTPPPTDSERDVATMCMSYLPEAATTLKGLSVSDIMPASAQIAQLLEQRGMSYKRLFQISTIMGTQPDL